MADADRENTDINTALDFLMGDTQPKPKSPPVATGDTTSPPRLRKQVDTAVVKPDRAPASVPTEPAKTRMGRPPGVKSGEARPKAKTSLALDRELMDFYREQTWSEQCQFGELVERALRDYAERNWKIKSN